MRGKEKTQQSKEFKTNYINHLNKPCWREPSLLHRQTSFEDDVGLSVVFTKTKKEREENKKKKRGEKKGHTEKKTRTKNNQKKSEMKNQKKRKAIR